MFVQILQGLMANIANSSKKVNKKGDIGLSYMCWRTFDCKHSISKQYQKTLAEHFKVYMICRSVKLTVWFELFMKFKVYQITWKHELKQGLCQSGLVNPYINSVGFVILHAVPRVWEFFTDTVKKKSASPACSFASLRNNNFKKPQHSKASVISFCKSLPRNVFRWIYVFII